MAKTSKTIQATFESLMEAAKGNVMMSEGNDNMTDNTPNPDTIEGGEIPSNDTPEAPKAKKSRKAKPEVKPEVKTEEKPKAEEKPAPKAFNGFELAADADASVVEAMAKEASEAFSTLADKDKETLEAYLSVGKAGSALAPLFKSPKIYGQFLAEKVPASAALDPALRSNCKWLYEALFKADHEASDLLIILGLDPKKNDPVSALKAYKSANPTVIRRDYRKAKDEVKLAEEAEEAGESVEAVKEKKAKEAKEAVTFDLNACMVAFAEWAALPPEGKAYSAPQQAAAKQTALNAAVFIRHILGASDKKELKVIMEGRGTYEDDMRGDDTDH